jgi:Uma2 family endonuclease
MRHQPGRVGSVPSKAGVEQEAMAAVPRPNLMTASDLLRMPDDGNLYELEEGRLIRVSPASSLPAIVAIHIAARFSVFATEHALGKVGGPDWGAMLFSNPDTVRAPDVAFVRAERFPRGRIPRGFLQGAPDIAVEVLSPSDRYSKTRRKVQEYLDAGARYVVIVEPFDRTAVVHRADGGVVEFGADGVLTFEDLLPGFSLSLSEVWEEADEDGEEA